MNLVGECLSIARAAAGVGIKHHVTCGGHQLQFASENISVSGEGTSVNFQNQRVLFIRVKVGRGNDPALNFLAVKT